MARVTLEDGDSISQSITAAITGKLIRVQFQIADFPGVNPILDLAIYAGRIPPASVLFTESVLLPGDDEIEFDWDASSANLIFTTDGQFTFELHTDAFSYVFAGDDDGYSNGELCLNGAPHPDVTDMAFVTFVDPNAVVVPLPPAIALLAPMLLSLGAIRR